MNVSFKLFAKVLVVLIGFQSIGYTRSETTTAADPCAAPNIRTDVRPHADGPPVEVTIRTFLFDVMQISDIEQTLTGDIAVVASWVDPRLSHLDGCEIRLEDVWSPGLAFVNSGRKTTELLEEVSIGPGLVRL